jgi:hypothetical protein
MTNAEEDRGSPGARDRPSRRILQTFSRRPDSPVDLRKRVERVTGIEPAWPAWKSRRDSGVVGTIRLRRRHYWRRRGSRPCRSYSQSCCRRPVVVLITSVIRRFAVFGPGTGTWLSQLSFLEHPRAPASLLPLGQEALKRLDLIRQLCYLAGQISQRDRRPDFGLLL